MIVCSNILALINVPIIGPMYLLLTLAVLIIHVLAVWQSH
jgi:hypothetical protein